MAMPWLPVIILVLGVFVGYSLIDRFDPSEKTLPVADPEFLGFSVIQPISWTFSEKLGCVRFGEFWTFWYNS